LHPGRAYNREQLLEEVWGQQHYVSPRTVDVHVRRLRERIETQPDDPQYLTTVRGFGYRFELPASEPDLKLAIPLH
jgi:two-component system phosphate regulon response regulator PhoB